MRDALFLNAHPIFAGGLVAWPALRRQAERVLADWGLEVDVDLDAERLTVEQRQIVEIARALLQGTRFIILDEPTAQLEGREVPPISCPANRSNRLAWTVRSWRIVGSGGCGFALESVA